VSTEQATLQEEDQGESTRAALALLRGIWKLKYLILVVTAITTVMVALWTLRQPKVYAASTTVEFDPTPPRPLGAQVEEVSAGLESYWSTREYYSTQFQVLQSQRVAEAVVRQLGLQHDPEFLGVSRDRRGSFRSVSVTAAAGVFRSRLRVESVKDSRLVLLSIEDFNPRRAQLIANTVASVYIRQNLDQRMSTTVSALEWLGDQLGSLRRQLDTSERALYDYRQNNNLLSTSFEERRDHVGNRISKLSEAVTDVQTRRIAIAARVAILRSALNATENDVMAMNAPELLASAPLQQLRTSLELLEREKAGLSPRYGANAAQMQAIQMRIEEVRTALRREVRNVYQSAAAELAVVRRTEGDLRSALGDAQREGLELNRREIEYGQLLRERENNSKLYGIVLERSKETQLTRMMRVNNVRVLDEALLPGAPIRPKVSTNILAGAGSGFVIGLILAYLVLLADRTMRTEGDVIDDLKATLLGVLPKISSRAAWQYVYSYSRSSELEEPVKNPDLIVHTHPKSAIAEACRKIRTNLLFLSPDTPFQVIMVGSSDPREGKTMVAISLSISLAQSGKKVLLIDTDLRRPRVAKAFELRPAVGIASVLINEATLDEAVVETDIPNLSLLTCPTAEIPPNPSELLHSQRFTDLIKTLRTKYDRIVFDTPPVGAVTDALVIGPQVDGVILVTRARKTVRARARSVLSQFRALGTRLAGVVLNDVDLRREGAEYYSYAASYEYKPQKEATE
jgi:capsular exopolysaccharide synthesis family protein